MDIAGAPDAGAGTMISDAKYTVEQRITAYFWFLHFTPSAELAAIQAYDPGADDLDHMQNKHALLAWLEERARARAEWEGRQALLSAPNLRNIDQLRAA
jgi:hypothetical protein